jgi:hypothetical protein
MAWDAKTRAMNIALAQLGKLPVTDLNEQSLRANAAAMKLSAFIDDARDQVLERQGWLCAMTYTALNPASDAAIALDDNWRFPVYYQLPGDCVKVWEVRTPTLIQPWWGDIDWIAFSELGPPVMEGEAWQVTTIDSQDGSSMKVLRTDLQDQLVISYTRRCNWAAFPFILLQAIGFGLAALGCYTVTADQSRQQKLEQLAEAKVLMALSTEATQEAGMAAIAPSIPARIRAISR